MKQNIAIAIRAGLNEGKRAHPADIEDRCIVLYRNRKLWEHAICLIRSSYTIQIIFNHGRSQAVFNKIHGKLSRLTSFCLPIINISHHKTKPKVFETIIMSIMAKILTRNHRRGPAFAMFTKPPQYTNRGNYQKSIIALSATH